MRHQLVGFGAGEAEHQPLVPCSARIDAHRDVRRLAVNRGQHGARLGVEAELAARVADFGDGRAHDLLEIDHRVGRDLAGHDGQTGGDQRLARDPADRVLGENRVENGVGNLIGDLVGMSFGDRFRRKKMPSLTAHAALLPSGDRH